MLINKNICSNNTLLGGGREEGRNRNSISIYTKESIGIYFRSQKGKEILFRDGKLVGLNSFY